MMKKVIAFAAFFIIAFPLFVSARVNVSDINIDVCLYENGDALITERWSAYADEATEFFIPVDVKNVGKIKDFSVSDEKRTYERAKNWDINASFEEKRGKYGEVVTENGGRELCFGISDYGNKEYTVSFYAEDIVREYNDCTALAFMFFPDNMAIYPTNITLTAHMYNGAPLNMKNASVSGYGFKGRTEVLSGKLCAESTEPVMGNDSFCIVMTFGDGIVIPKKHQNMNLLSELKNEANIGRTIEPAHDYSDIVLWLSSAAAAAVVIFAFLFIKRKTEISRIKKNASVFSGIPNDGKLDVSYFILKCFGDKSYRENFICASIFDLANNGNIDFYSTSDGEIIIALLSEPYDDTGFEMYSMLKAAANGESDLTGEELSNYFKNHRRQIKDFLIAAYTRGRDEFVLSEGFKDMKPSRRTDSLTIVGKKQISELAGFEKYVSDVSAFERASIDNSSYVKKIIIYSFLIGKEKVSDRNLSVKFPDLYEDSGIDSICMEFVRNTVSRSV